MDTATVTRCTWPPCCREIGPNDDTVDVPGEGIVEHALCNFQRLDEDELREFLDQVARDSAEKIKEYKSLHPSRANEHRARALLSRLEAVIAAAVVAHAPKDNPIPALAGRKIS